MKRFNLISIITFLFALMLVQSTVAQTTVTGQYSQSGSTIYAAKYAENNQYTVLSRGYTEKALTINFDYPINKITYTAWLSDDVTESHTVTLTAGSQTQITELNNDEDTDGLFGKDKNDDYTEYVALDVTDKTIRTIKFNAKRSGAGLKDIYLKDIFLYMAPHTILNTKSLSFNTALTDEDGETKTIDFHSFLTGSNGMTISIVNVKDKNGNPITIEGLSLSKTSVGANIFEAIDKNDYSFNLTFQPKQIITNATCSIKIENTGAETQYVQVTLNSSLETPTLKCDASGYTFAKLSWNAIEGADSYKLYDGNTLINTYTTTTATITNLNYNSNHSYTITSVVGSAESNKSNTVTVNCPAYPSVQNITFPDIQQNQVTIQWDAVNLTPANHTIVKYHIHLYQPSTAGTFIEAQTTTETSCTFTNLIDNTQYTVYIDVEYQYTLNGENITDTDWFWSYKSFNTTSFITGEAFDGVKMYQNVWYRVNLNSNIDISTNTWNTAAEKIHTMSLNYPCEKKVDFQINTSEVLNIYGPADIKIDESKTGKWDDTKNIHDKSYRGENQSGTTNTSGHDVKALKFYCDGGENSNEYVHDIWLQIAPHILLKETKYVKNFENTTATQTTNAVIDFGTIEIGHSKPVNIDFQSFLSKGEIKALLSDNTDSEIFWLNSVRSTKEHSIAPDNTLEYVNKNDNNFTISFNPAKAGEYTGTLIIKDDAHTVTLTLKATCVKKTPEISWINDKYISLGEMLSGAAFSTYGTVKYQSLNGDIIAINSNLLESKTLGSTEIIAIIEESEKWYGARDTATFTVTDKIIQTIEWEQDFTSLKTTDGEIELTAKAITRTTGEENSNPIEYSSADESIVKIVDGKLQIVGIGSTYITAHQQGNDEYAPTYMTKRVFIRQVSNGCENFFALEYAGETFGDGSIISSGFNWGPFEFEKELETIGDVLSFKTTKNTATTGGGITITDDLGNIVYDNDLGKTETNISINREVRKLTFTLEGNLQVSISDIKVTPAIYINPDKEFITFSSTEVDLKAIEEIEFDWANQPDYARATIIDDEEGVFSVDSKTAIFGSSTCGDYGTSTVKVIFAPKKEANYTAKLAIYVGEKTEPKITIPINGVGARAKQEIYWLNYPLTTADKEINIAQTTASTRQPITYTLVSGNNIVAINEDYTLTILNEGTFTLSAQQMGNESYLPTEKITKEFTVTIGNLIFDNKNGDNNWSTIENWKPDSRLNIHRNITPEENVNLSITTSSIVGNNTKIINPNTTSISNQGSITIAPQGSLNVNNIVGSNGDNIILQANEKGNATFTFVTGTPSATVEMYSKAQYGTTATDGHHPEWQYMGVAVNGAEVSDFKYNDERDAWLLKWEEKDNITGDPWSDAPLAANTELNTWAGYSISQPTATTYTTKGSLCNENHIYTLTRTTREGAQQDPDCGFNLLANSYTAPIDITKLTVEDFENADACIVLYNTGTYYDWEDKQGESGEKPGQLTVIPVKTVGETDLPKTIASMQAFFVMAQENNATFSVDYETDVLGAENHNNQMRAPKERKEFNVLKITIEGKNTRDHLWLFENELTTKAYDNGYEARKIFDAPCGHQMYATCEYGYASINCSESIVGQAIGLKGDNEGELLTITFDTDRLAGYESLYLYDNVTGKYINITAGEKYTFYGIKGANDNRFSIVTNPDDEAQTPPFIVIGNRLIFDQNQIEIENTYIYIYDTSGRLLITERINAYESYNIPDMPNGIYLVRMNEYTTKIIKN